MAVWADIGEDDEPSDFIRSQVITRSTQEVGAYQKEGHDELLQRIEDDSATYVAHALRCYP